MFGIREKVARRLFIQSLPVNQEYRLVDRGDIEKILCHLIGSERFPWTGRMPDEPGNAMTGCIFNGLYGVNLIRAQKDDFSFGTIKNTIFADQEMGRRYRKNIFGKFQIVLNGDIFVIHPLS